MFSKVGEVDATRVEAGEEVLVEKSMIVRFRFEPGDFEEIQLKRWEEKEVEEGLGSIFGGSVRESPVSSDRRRGEVDEEGFGVGDGEKGADSRWTREL